MEYKYSGMTLDKGTIRMILDDYRYSELSVEQLSDKWGLPESTIFRVLKDCNT
jgi:hypothetical protein